MPDQQIQNHELKHALKADSLRAKVWIAQQEKLGVKKEDMDFSSSGSDDFSSSSSSHSVANGNKRSLPDRSLSSDSYEGYHHKMFGDH